MARGKPKPGQPEGPNDGCVIAVHVTPRARRKGISFAGDVVRVAVTEAPVDGAANAAVIEALARALGVPRSRITITSGSGSRHKRVTVAGLTAAQVAARLAGS